MIGAIVQAGLGVAQMVGGLTMPKPEIPDYEIPAETYKNMTDAEYWSFQGLPEAQKQQFVEQSSRAGATALSQSASRKGGLGMVSSVAQQEQDSATQLLSMDAQQRMSNLQNLYASRDKMSAARDTKYGEDKGKVMYQLEKRNEMIGAGMANMGGGLGGILDQVGDAFGGGGGGGSTAASGSSSGSTAASGSSSGSIAVPGSMGGTPNYGAPGKMPTTLNKNDSPFGKTNGFGGFN